MKNLYLKYKKNLIYFLRKSEKWTKTDMVYLVNSGAWLTIARIISTFFSLGLAVVFANFLPAEVYGVYKYILSIVAIITIVTLPGIGTSVIRSVSRGSEHVIFSAFRVKTKWSMAGATAGLILSGYYFVNDNEQLSLLFLIVSFFIPLTNTFNLFAAYLSGKKEFKDLAQFNIIFSIVQAISLAAAVFFSGSVYLIIIIYFSVTFVLHFIFYIISIKKHPPNMKKDSECVNFGKHITMMSVLEVAASNLDKILVGHFLGLVDLAIYAFALNPIKNIQAFFGKSIGQLAYAKFAEKDESTLKRTLPGKVLKMYFVIVPIIIFYYFLSPYLYQLLFPKYTDSIAFSRALSLILLSSPLMFFSNALLAKMKKKSLYFNKTISNLSLILLLFLLVPIYGLWGVIYARLFFYIINGISTIFLFIRMK